MWKMFIGFYHAVAGNDQIRSTRESRPKNGFSRKMRQINKTRCVSVDYGDEKEIALKFQMKTTESCVDTMKLI